MKNKKLKILLASPRGFCAGVDRAILMVEEALKKYGKPVYVRHEIVHNKYVVQDLKSKGAIFIDELQDIKNKDRPVIFSAHGVPKSIPETAKNLQRKKYLNSRISFYVRYASRRGTPLQNCMNHWCFCTQVPSNRLPGRLPRAHARPGVL